MLVLVLNLVCLLKSLLKMIGRRKRLLGYVRGKSEQRYSDLISKLGIRG